MRRVVVLQEYVPEYRAPFFERLSRECEAAGISLTVHAGHPGQDLASRADAVSGGLGSPLRQREFALGGRRVTIRSIRRAVEGADLVVIEQARRNIDAYRLLLPKRTWPARRVAMWGHGRDYVERKTRLETRLQEMLTRRVDHFFAYTEAGGRHVESLGLDASRITVLRNSTDARAFEEQLARITDEDAAHFLGRHGLTSKTLLYVGGLDPSKRLDLLLEAFHLAQLTEPDLSLAIVGDGPDRGVVEVFAARHTQVAYLGRRDGADKALAFRASTALAIPGRVGLVAVDSIASGLPILTTDWEFHAPEFEYLVPGESVFVSSLSPASYSELIVSLMNSPQLLSKASSALRQQAPSFGVETMAENFVNGLRAMGIA